MKKIILFLLTFFSVALFAGDNPLSMEELAATMDRQTLETEISRFETVGEAIGEAERLKRLGIAWHNLAVIKVGDASDEAEKWLKKALDAVPRDYEVMAYYGSARTMVARDSWNVLTKMSKANKGIAIIDKAIRKAPDNVIVRMVRANNSLALPEMFERRVKAGEDFGYLHERLDKLGVSRETKAEICFKLAEILREDGDEVRARALYGQAGTLSPDGVWAKRAKRRL